MKNKKNDPLQIVAVKCYQAALSAIKPQFRKESLVGMIIMRRSDKFLYPESEHASAQLRVINMAIKYEYQHLSGVKGRR